MPLDTLAEALSRVSLMRYRVQFHLESVKLAEL